MKSLAIIRTWLCLVALHAVITYGQSSQFTWIATAPGEWENPNNWDCGPVGTCEINRPPTNPVFDAVVEFNAPVDMPYNITISSPISPPPLFRAPQSGQVNLVIQNGATVSFTSFQTFLAGYSFFYSGASSSSLLFGGTIFTAIRYSLEQGTRGVFSLRSTGAFIQDFVAGPITVGAQFSFVRDTDQPDLLPDYTFLNTIIDDSQDVPGGFGKREIIFDAPPNIESDFFTFTLQDTFTKTGDLPTEVFSDPVLNLLSFVAADTLTASVDGNSQFNVRQSRPSVINGDWTFQNGGDLFLVGEGSCELGGTFKRIDDPPPGIGSQLLFAAPQVTFTSTAEIQGMEVVVEHARPAENATHLEFQGTMTNGVAITARSPTRILSSDRLVITSLKGPDPGDLIIDNAMVTTQTADGDNFILEGSSELTIEDRSENLNTVTFSSDASQLIINTVRPQVYGAAGVSVVGEGTVLFRTGGHSVTDLDANAKIIIEAGSVNITNAVLQSNIQITSAGAGSGTVIIEEGATSMQLNLVVESDVILKGDLTVNSGSIVLKFENGVPTGTITVDGAWVLATGLTVMIDLTDGIQPSTRIEFAMGGMFSGDFSVECPLCSAMPTVSGIDGGNVLFIDYSMVEPTPPPTTKPPTPEPTAPPTPPPTLAPTDSPTSLPTAPPTEAPPICNPILECLEELVGGDVLAHFGYNCSDTLDPTTNTVGPANQVVSGNALSIYPRGRSSFYPRAAFTIKYKGGFRRHCYWNLAGVQLNFLIYKPADNLKCLTTITLILRFKLFIFKGDKWEAALTAYLQTRAGISIKITIRVSNKKQIEPTTPLFVDLTSIGPGSLATAGSGIGCGTPELTNGVNAEFQAAGIGATMLSCSTQPNGGALSGAVTAGTVSGAAAGISAGAAVGITIAVLVIAAVVAVAGYVGYKKVYPAMTAIKPRPRTVESYHPDIQSQHVGHTGQRNTASHAFTSQHNPIGPRDPK